MNNMPFLKTLLIFLSIIVISCDNQVKNKYTLGDAKLEVTGNDLAQEFFTKGLLLLHSFEYEDAKEAFVSAQEADSTMAMAYWGEAMTYNHPLWRSQDYEKATKALHQFGETKEIRQEKISTKLEKDLFNASEILYGSGDKHERDVAYAEYMSQLYEKYPDNLEVAAFYAISLLGSVKEGRDDEIYEKGAAIAQGILNENPNHPGALHYLIHSFDDPKNARRALAAANSYATVAKDAGHALHMPSHIYVSMGMWKEVVASNEASYAASISRMERKSLDNNARGYHALHWLMYGYLQQGRYKEAYEIVQNMKKYTSELPSRRARSYMIYMENTYLVETNDWLNTINDIRVDYENINVRSAAKFAFSDGVKAYVEKNKAKLSGQIIEIEKDLGKAEGQLETRGVAMCGGNWMYSTPNQQDIDEATVIQLELQALEAWLEKDTVKTEFYFQKAMVLEDQISFSFGPPIIAKPSYEMYGDWLLRLNRSAEAIIAYNRALEKGPNRVRSLYGKLRSAEIINDAELQTETQALLEKILHLADSKSIEFLEESKLFL